MGIIPYIINFIGLIVYIFGPFNKTALPVKINFIVFTITIIYLFIEHYNYSIQHTTFSMARHYLLDRNGLHYNSSDVFKIQTFLNPKHYSYTMLTMYCVNVICFNLLLFYQGWVMAISLYVVSFILGTIIPINYTYYLKIVRNSLKNQKMLDIAFNLVGIDAELLNTRITEYIVNKVDIHALYHKRISDLTKNEIGKESL